MYNIGGLYLYYRKQASTFITNILIDPQLEKLSIVQLESTLKLLEKSKVKKILMVCEAFGGGVFTYLSQLCNDMLDSFDVYLAYSVRTQTPNNFKDFICLLIQEFT
jgi:hypothetical protein